MPDVPVVIVSRDRLAPLRELIEWLGAAGHRRVHILDNDSAYPPLLSYFEQLPRWVALHRLGANVGSFAPWVTGFTREQFPAEYYIVTDPDVVPDESCPAGLAEHLVTTLDAYPDRVKVGVGLRLDDLPACYKPASDVREFEGVYWQKEITPGLFDAEVDTTFAVYRPGSHSFARGPALRTGAPYLARHAGWYIDSANPTAEEVFYNQRASRLWATWNGGADRPRWLREAVHIRATNGRGVRSKLYKASTWARNHRQYPKEVWDWQVVKRLERLRRNAVHHNDE